jgi:acetyl-CoA carboxylase biotin carboxylase subunit
VEFLVDQDNNFFFMEVNTRIQVEHTVSEELTGIDLVAMQLRVAKGEELPFKQKDISFRGHVMEFRINAENPAQNFTPSPGRLEYYLPPGGPHVRVDSACYAGYSIPPHYDSMIAKLIVRGDNRQEVMERARRALREFHIAGVHSTIPFHLFMLDHKPFQDASFDLNYIDRLVADKDVWDPIWTKKK